MSSLISKVNAQGTGLRIAVFLLLFHTGWSQEIPLGTWRAHISYSSIHSLTQSLTKIYAAAPNGIVIVDREDASLSTLTKLDGLSGIGVTSIAFDQPRNQLVVAYEDGNLDFVSENEIFNFSGLKNSTTISGSKRINQVSIQNDYAYLSTDFGLVVFDLTNLEVKETWRDLGSSGEQIRIYESTFKPDSIFLATENGVLAGSLNDNLLDFNNWVRFDQGNFSGDIQSITFLDDKIYAAIDGDGIYRYETGAWTLESFLQGSDFNSLSSFGNLLIATATGLWRLNNLGVLTEASDDLIVNPLTAIEDGNGKLWIGDNRNGLISDETGSFQSYSVSGPSFPGSFRLKFNNERIYAVAGGYTSGFSPSGKTEFVNNFSSGVWGVEPVFFQDDVTDVDFSGTKTFVSSFTEGLQVLDNVITVYDELNSPLVGSRVSAIATSADGLWVANYNSTQSLHLLKNDNTWESFSFPVLASQFPVDLVVDYLGHVWMALNPTYGGILVFDPDNNQHVYLTQVSGSGGLPSAGVYSLASDRDGEIWVGTDAGVAYFPDPSDVFSAGVNAVKPVFNGRFLLRDEKTTSIAVDGGNRKWLGTERGVWLFNPFGEEQVYQFNAENSPLLSDKIHAMEIQPVTGEVFFGTDKGIISFRSDATSGKNSFSAVKIFPNPVTAEFSGTVGISGLSTDALIKITDVSGKLVWQTQANGSTAAWNVRDHNGRRAASGIYLVFAITQDGSESMVGKIAVVN